MRKLNLPICIGLLLFVALGCSMMKDSKTAEPAVEKFHTQFNAKQFSEIYNGSGDSMKGATTEKQLTDLLDGVYRKLGTYKNSTATSWHVNTTPSSTMVTLSYDTEFSDGKASETFVVSVSGDTAKLEGYNINSNDLITK